jgi:iduronate 2-sulfatase
MFMINWAWSNHYLQSLFLSSFVLDDYARLVVQSYYAAVSYIDDLVGQMLSELEAVGLSNNTIILLVGDHGKYECINVRNILSALLVL